MTKINCSVEECKYNSNLYCHADEIQVAGRGNQRVGTSDGTLCKTFVYHDNKKTLI